jgi:selenophosphate synthetase-related protein
MASRKGRAKPPAPLRWTTRDMRARVDISDREAVLAAIDKNDV